MMYRVFIALLALLITGCVYTGEVMPGPVVGGTEYRAEGELIESPSLKLVTFNIAHGRRDRFSQILLDETTIRRNLRDVAAYLGEIDPHIVALQEADGPSRWSGNFDHMAFLAEEVGFRFYARSEHVTNWWGDYGTGLLSHHYLDSVVSHHFKPSPPTTRKGFTLATVRWRPTPHASPLAVDVVSLHLDFARESVRRQQLQELADVLLQRRNPLVLMGDFNSEHIAATYLAELLAGRTRLRVYADAAARFPSFGGRKLDWVVISEELEFASYRVDDVSLSDHRPVIVELKLAGAVRGLPLVEATTVPFLPGF